MVGQDARRTLESANARRPGAGERLPRGSQAWNGELSSGLVIDIPQGDVKFADPTRPNVSFDPFVQAVLRQIGAALEIPFELLIKHFTSSYTAARAALLDFWLFVRRRREWLAATFCQPIYQEWLRCEIASGDAAPGFFANPLTRHAWCEAYRVGDSMGVLDLTARQPREKHLELGITTRGVPRHDGSNWGRHHEQQVRSMARVAAGLIPRRSEAPTPRGGREDARAPESELADWGRRRDRASRMGGYEQEALIRGEAERQTVRIRAELAQLERRITDYP